MFNILKALILAALFCTLSACTVMPKTTHYYDNDCHKVSKKYSLTMKQHQSFIVSKRSCTNDQCITLLFAQVLGSAVVVSASAVISGSIVLVGNTAHWLERQHCRLQESLEQA